MNVIEHQWHKLSPLFEIRDRWDGPLTHYNEVAKPICVLERFPYNARRAEIIFRETKRKKYVVLQKNFQICHST